MTIPANWRKSRFSANNTNCVMIRRDLGALGDTKNPGTALTVPPSAVTALVRSLR